MPIWFSYNLRFLRKQQGFDMMQFAQKLDVPLEWLSLLESGDLEPNLAQLIQISDLLHTPVDRLLKQNIEQQHELIHYKDIQLILLDVDGTLTDAGLYYTESGDMMKKFHARDGMAIHRLVKRRGMRFGFVSSSTDVGILEARGKKLGVQHIYGGLRPKIEVVEEWCQELEIQWEQIAYVGDDVNDTEMMKKVGLAVCPADAMPPIKELANIILTKAGGDGCVREFLIDVMGYDIISR